MVRNTSVLIIFLFLSLVGYCQTTYRFKSEITIKVKNQQGAIQYTKGTVRYDKNIKKLLFHISFPQKEFYVSSDTIICKYQNNKLLSIQSNPLKPEFSIFHFILNNDLSDFGLKNSNFSITNIEKSNDLIITKWSPPAIPNFPLGNILVSSKNKRLQSVLIYNQKGELLNRQIYKKYSFVNGVEIPSEILSVSDIAGVKTYQIIEFDKIQINEQGNDPEYDFQLEKNKK
jgi:hypothetical protein